MNPENVLEFIFFMLLGYGALRFSRLVYGDYFAPMGLFFGVNLAALSLYHLKLLPLIQISGEAYLLIMASFFSFLTGSLLASPFFALKGRTLPIWRHSNKHEKTSAELTAFYYLTASLGLAGWIFYVTVVVPPGWLSNPFLLQGTGQYVIPYHLGYLLIAGALVPPIFVLLVLSNQRISPVSICCLLAEVAALMLAGVKSFFVLAMGTSLLVWALTRPGKVQPKHLGVLALAIVGFMALYDRFIDVFVPRQFSGSMFPPVLSFLEKPYLYITGPWAALSAVIASPPAHVHWAQHTLEPLWKVLGPGGVGVVERVPEYLPFVDIGPSLFNTYSFIGELYWDFGWLGSLLGSFLVGFISTALYVAARKRNNWVLRLLSALFSYALFISMFMYYFRSTLVFLLLYTLVIGSLIKRLAVSFRLFKPRISAPKTKKAVISS